MNLIKKIALLSLIASLTSINVQADELSDLKKDHAWKSSDKPNGIDPTQVTVTFDTTKTPSEIPFTLQSATEKILQARFGSDYQRYLQLTAPKTSGRLSKIYDSQDLFAKKMRDSGLNKDKVENDITTVNTLIQQKNRVNQQIQTVPLVDGKDVASAFAGNSPKKEYTVAELNARLEEYKASVACPTDMLYYQDIVDFKQDAQDVLNALGGDSFSETDTTPITLMDGINFAQSIHAKIKEILSTYKVSEQDPISD